MRAAPAVATALAAGGPERMLITLLHALAGGLLAAWQLAWAGIGPGLAGAITLALAVAVAAVVGAWLARRALPAAHAQLRWDGQAWSLLPAAGPDGGLVLADVSVTLDLGRWLLLRLHPAAGGTTWRTARAGVAGPAWHALRVALVAHGGRPAAVAADAGQAP